MAVPPPSWFDQLDISAQARITAFCLAGIARTFRHYGSNDLADSALASATWFSDLAADICRLEDKP